MTNKEKYPNASIQENTSAYKCGGTFYISLTGHAPYDLLLKNGIVGSHVWDKPELSYYSTRQEAQTALDNFMNEKKPIALDEIKSQLSEAKKLIGKKVCPKSSSAFIVEDVILDVSGVGSSWVCNEFFDKNGYVIKVCGNQGVTKVPYTADLKPVSVVEVTNHRGEKYIAQDNGQTWKFGCAEISKSLVMDLHGALSAKRLHGNRQALKVTIGAADFDVDTLKALVELEEENK